MFLVFNANIPANMICLVFNLPSKSRYMVSLLFGMSDESQELQLVDCTSESSPKMKAIKTLSEYIKNPEHSLDFWSNVTVSIVVNYHSECLKPII